jgi:hypothetical protein
MMKLFGFVRSRAGQPARLVRVETTGSMSRDELRRKLTEISARKQRVYKTAYESGVGRGDDQPPSRRERARAKTKAAGWRSPAAFAASCDRGRAQRVSSSTIAFAS